MKRNKGSIEVVVASIVPKSDHVNDANILTEVEAGNYPRGPNYFDRVSPASSALWIELTRSSRLNGLMSRAIGGASSARLRVSSSVCAVIRMTGSLHPEVLPVAAGWLL
jgi:hypothetical protein